MTHTSLRSPLESAPAHSAPHVLILGGGYVGMYTALRLRHRLRGGEAKISIIDPKSYMTYQPFLPEAAAGTWPSVMWLLRFGRSCAVRRCLTAA